MILTSHQKTILINYNQLKSKSFHTDLGEIENDELNYLEDQIETISAKIGLCEICRYNFKDGILKTNIFVKGIFLIVVF